MPFATARYRRHGCRECRMRHQPCRLGQPSGRPDGDVTVANLALTARNWRCGCFCNRIRWTLMHPGNSFTVIFGCGSGCRWRGRRVSFQITVLKVLAGHPQGHASLADLKHYVAVLTCSGADWSQRMKRLAARAPDLDIFSSGYVLREPSGWQITAKGRDFLIAIEAPLAEPALTPVALPTSVVSDPTDLPPNVVQLAGHKIQPARRAA